MEDVSVKDIREATAIVRKATAFFKPLQKLDEALMALEVFEQTRTELNVAIAQLQKEMGVLQSEKSELMVSVAAQKQKNIEEHANSGAELKKAGEQAMKILADARSGAASIDTAARAAHQKSIDEAKALVAKLRADADAVKAELKDETAKLAAIKAAIFKITGA